MTNSLFFQQLNTEMIDRTFLKNNPVFVKAKSGSLPTEVLGEVIRQYVRFPEEIVKMLRGAAAHFPKNHPVHQELERNWGQESGSETGGIAHVQILKHGLKRDLSLNIDHVKGSGATEQFIATVLDGMKENPWFALGQAFALEASAVPELAILVGPAINLYASKVGKPEPIKKVALQEDGTFALPTIKTAQEAYAMDMSSWFALHIVDLEVGHRDFLRERATGVLTNEAKQEEFARGFRQVLGAMDRWWFALSEGE
ncbi:MAG: DUF3865 domain-containing protein [Patescibacteria group bacterium]